MTASLKRSIPLLIATLALPATAMADTTGMREFSLRDATAGRDTQGFVWYPAGDAEKTVLAHGNVVWEAISVAPDAPPLPGAHPLVLLSHGMFGNARNQAWLAEELVARGFVVLAIDHPGTSTFQRDADQRRMLWERPRDISRALTELLADPELGPLIDRERIFMAGHSLGGFTAMELAGGRFSSAHLAEFCTGHSADLVCGLFADWQVAGTPEDRAAMEGDLSDPRIRAFAVFDLGGTQSFAPESLGAVTRPVLLYGAPDGGHVLDLDAEARALAAALPPATVTYHELPGLAHFDFLGICNPGALEVLEAEEPEDVVVCAEGGEERRARHRRIAGEVADFFAAQ